MDKDDIIHDVEKRLNESLDIIDEIIQDINKSDPKRQFGKIHELNDHLTYHNEIADEEEAELEEIFNERELEYNE